MANVLESYEVHCGSTVSKRVLWEETQSCGFDGTKSAFWRILYKCIPEGVVVQGRTLLNLQKREGASVHIPMQIKVSQTADMRTFETQQPGMKNDDGETGCEMKSGVSSAQHHNERSQGENKWGIHQSTCDETKKPDGSQHAGFPLDDEIDGTANKSTKPRNDKCLVEEVCGDEKAIDGQNKGNEPNSSNIETGREIQSVFNSAQYHNEQSKGDMNSTTLQEQRRSSDLNDSQIASDQCEIQIEGKANDGQNKGNEPNSSNIETGREIQSVFNSAQYHNEQRKGDMNSTTLQEQRRSSDLNDSQIASDQCEIQIEGKAIDGQNKGNEPNSSNIETGREIQSVFNSAQYHNEQRKGDMNSTTLQEQRRSSDLNDSQIASDQCEIQIEGKAIDGQNKGNEPNSSNIETGREIQSVFNSAQYHNEQSKGDMNSTTLQEQRQSSDLNDSQIASDQCEIQIEGKAIDGQNKGNEPNSSNIETGREIQSVFNSAQYHNEQRKGDMNSTTLQEQRRSSDLNDSQIASDQCEIQIEGKATDGQNKGNEPNSSNIETGREIQSVFNSAQYHNEQSKGDMNSTTLQEQRRSSDLNDSQIASDQCEIQIEGKAIDGQNKGNEPNSSNIETGREIQSVFNSAQYHSEQREGDINSTTLQEQRRSSDLNDIQIASDQCEIQIEGKAIDGQNKGNEPNSSNIETGHEIQSVFNSAQYHNEQHKGDINSTTLQEQRRSSDLNDIQIASDQCEIQIKGKAIDGQNKGNEPNSSNIETGHEIQSVFSSAQYHNEQRKGDINSTTLQEQRRSIDLNDSQIASDQCEIQIEGKAIDGQNKGNEPNSSNIETGREIQSVFNSAQYHNEQSKGNMNSTTLQEQRRSSDLNDSQIASDQCEIQIEGKAIDGQNKGNEPNSSNIETGREIQSVFNSAQYHNEQSKGDMNSTTLQEQRRSSDLNDSQIASDQCEIQIEGKAIDGQNKGNEPNSSNIETGREIQSVFNSAQYHNEQRKGDINSIKNRGNEQDSGDDDSCVAIHIVSNCTNTDVKTKILQPFTLIESPENERNVETANLKPNKSLDSSNEDDSGSEDDARADDETESNETPTNYPRQIRATRASKQWTSMSMCQIFDENFDKFSALVTQHRPLEIKRTEKETGPPDVTVYCHKCNIYVVKRDSEKYFRYKEEILTHINSQKHQVGLTSYEKSPMLQRTLKDFFKGATFSKIENQASCDTEETTKTQKEPSICLGFGHLIGLTQGSDSSSKGGALFRVDPSFHGINKNTGVEVTGGTAFGAGKYKCLQVTTNQMGICLNCQRAKTDPMVQKAVRQRKYQSIHVKTISKRKQCKRQMKNYILGLPNRSSSIPAGTPLAKRCTPLKYFSKAEQPLVRRLNKDTSVLNAQLEGLRESTTLHNALTNGTFKEYVIEKSTMIRGSSEHVKKGVTSIILAICNNLLKAKSPKGYRYESPLKDLAVLLLNKSPSSYQLLSMNLPGVIPNISTAQRYTRNTKLDVIDSDTVCGLFQNCGSLYSTVCLGRNWLTAEGTPGPCQLCIDSTRTREIIKPDTKRKLLIGFAASKKEKKWHFQYPYSDTVIEIAKIFDEIPKAGYVMLGLLCALCPNIPPIPIFVIPHTNHYSLSDQSEWLIMVEDLCASANIPLVKLAGDADAKNLSYFEKKMQRDKEDAIGLDIPGWFLWANESKCGLPLSIGLDPRHGIRNGRMQLLKFQKLLITPAGLVSAQHIYAASTVDGSHVYHGMFDPSDKTNHSAAEDMVAGFNRRAVYEAGMSQTVEINGGTFCLPQQFMGTVVFMYLNECIYRIYQSKTLSIYSRLMKCGLIYRVVYAWRTWLILAKGDGLRVRNNHFSTQHTKFMLIQAQGFVTRLLGHIKHFPALPFYPFIDGSDQCENWFRDMKAKSGIFCVKDLCDNTSNIVASSIVKSKGNVILPRNETFKKCDESIFHDLPKDCFEVRKAFDRGLLQGNILLKLLGMYEQLNFHNRVHNPLIPKWTSTRDLLNDFDDGGCSDEDDSDEEIGQEHCSSEELSYQEIITGLNEIVSMFEGNTHKEEDHIHQEAKTSPEQEVEAIYHNSPPAANNPLHEPNPLTTAKFMQSFQNIREKIDVMVIKKELHDVGNLLHEAEYLQKYPKTKQNRQAISNMIDELEVLQDLVPMEKYEETRVMKPEIAIKKNIPTVTDQKGNILHPATVCSILSKEGEILPSGVGRLQKWMYSQEWLKKIQRPVSLGEVIYGKTVAYHKPSNRWGVGRVEIIIEEVGKHYQMTQKLDLTKANSFVAVRDFSLSKSFGRPEKLGGPLYLDDVIKFIPMKCIFCVPVRLDLCLDGSNFEINSEKLNELNVLANSFIVDRKRDTIPEKMPVKIEYKHDVYVKHYKNRTLSTLNLETLKKYLLYHNLKVVGTKDQVIKRIEQDMITRWKLAVTTERVRNKLAMHALKPVQLPGVESSKTIMSTYHQGSDVFPGLYRGTQCTTMALAATIYAKSKCIKNWDTCDLDNILFCGSDLHTSVSKDSRTKYSSPNTMPTCIKYSGRRYVMSLKGEFGGNIFYQSDPLGDFIEYSLASAISKAFDDNSVMSCYLTYNNDFTVALFFVKDDMHPYRIFDSHARLRDGSQGQNGSCVLLSFESVGAVVAYIRRFVTQMRSTPEQADQFYLAQLQIKDEILAEPDEDLVSMHCHQWVDLTQDTSQSNQSTPKKNVEYLKSE